MQASQLLRERRRERGLTQSDLAKALSCDQSTVSYYERGGRPPYEKAVQLESLFEIPVSAWAIPPADTADRPHAEADRRSCGPAQERGQA